MCRYMYSIRVLVHGYSRDVHSIYICVSGVGERK